MDSLFGLARYPQDERGETYPTGRQDFSGARREVFLIWSGRAARRRRRAFQLIEMLADMRCLGGRVGKGDCPAESVAGLAVAPQLFQQIAAHPVEIEIAVQQRGQWRDHLQRRLGAVEFRDRNGPVECNDRGWSVTFEGFVEFVDAGPVRLLRPFGLGVQRSDRGLNLIWAGLAVQHGLVDHRERFGDLSTIPYRSVLILQEDRCARLVEPCLLSRVL